jgi:hypothetical protein
MHDQSQLDDVLVMTASIIHDAAIMQSMARTSGRVPSIEAVRRLYQSVQVLAMIVKKPATVTPQGGLSQAQT